MYDRWLIVEEGFKNVRQNGQVTGFQVRVRIGNYRGLPLSLIDDMQVKVDGQSFSRDQIRFTVAAGTFTLDELKQRPDARWQFTEFATLTVLNPGGLTPGFHTVEVTEKFRSTSGALPAKQGPAADSVGMKKMVLVV